MIPITSSRDLGEVFYSNELPIFIVDPNFARVASVGETFVSLAWSLSNRELSIMGRAEGEEQNTTYASGITASDYILDGLDPETTYTMYVCHTVNDEV
ncbi:MAG: hypothetical protein K6F79_06665 [Saccharofermentans sp.]|nr:hypothetical protein [Saccharofermentans sp.]